MHTTIIHPIRKAFNLTCNDYVILQAIYGLSKNEKYGNWCIASKAQLAEWYDLSERGVFNIINTLEVKGLIIKDSKTGWIKTSDEWNEIQANTHDWLIGFDGQESQFISGKQKRWKVKSDCRGYEKSAEGMKKVQRGYEKSADNNNKDNNKYISKEISKENLLNISLEKPSISYKKDPLPPDIAPPPPPNYGRPELNDLLSDLKSHIGITAFADSNIERRFAKHIYNLIHKIGKKEFYRRLDILLGSWQRGRMNHIAAVYSEIKAFIEPKSSEPQEHDWRIKRHQEQLEAERAAGII